jgi:hypothetical protein
VLAIVFYDFVVTGITGSPRVRGFCTCRASPELRNPSTALRQTSTGAPLGWVFYLPMAIVGHPADRFAVALIDLLASTDSHGARAQARWLTAARNAGRTTAAHAVNDHTSIETTAAS